MSRSEAVADTLILSALYVYPIKSAGGIALDRALLEPRGLRFDRRWMVIKADGKLATQREFPKMRLIRVSLLPQTDPFFSLLVEAPGLAPLRVPRVPTGPLVHTQVWEDATVALRVSPEASQWFSELLVPGCELLYMPDDADRAQSNKPFSSLLSFADGNPFHLVSEASLADLNARLDRSVGPAVFRPNVVVRGGAAYAEDFWRRIRIGDSEFLVVESCARCSVLNVAVAGEPPEARMGAEPLRTLARYRRRGASVPFGQNMLQGEALFRPGRWLEVGAPVTVCEVGTTPNPSY